MTDVERENAKTVWADAVAALDRAFGKFADNLADNMSVVVKAFRAAFPIAPEVRLAQTRARYGGMGEDAQRWPDRWYSTHCTAWLCGACPSDEHGLRCNCPHHRKVK